jgi:WD40 repeat protein
VAFSPDGRRIASAAGWEVKVWDAQTGQELLDLDTGPVNGVAFSPDGTRIASGSGEPFTPGKAGELKVWDARTGQLLLDLKGHTHAVRSVAFSPDGQRLATGSDDQTVKVWDARPGFQHLNQQLTLKGHAGEVTSVCFSPDGKRIASASRGYDAEKKQSLGEVKVWDARTGQQLLAPQGHTGWVLSVAFSPDGQRIASASGGVWDEQKKQFLGRDEVKVWAAQTGQQLLTLKGHTANVTSVCFSPDGQRLASASGENLHGTGGRPGEVKVWDARTGQQLLDLQGHKGPVTSVCFSPDGQRLASGSKDFTVKVWDVRTGQPLLTLEGHTDDVTSVAFSPDGKRLASGGSGGRDATTALPAEVKVWDAQTGQQLLNLKGHTGFVTSVCFSADGQRLASATGNQPGEVTVWDARTGQQLLTLKGYERGVTSVALSPDGQRLATGSSNFDQGKQFGEVKVWDVRATQEVLALQGHTNWVSDVAFSPDGQRIATGSWDKTVKVWDAHSGQQLLALQGHTGDVTSVAFSPDGLRLASGSGDKTVKVWDAQSGQGVLTFKGHTGGVGNVAFSPDGQRIASASEVWDAQKGQHVSVEVKVWDARTGQELLSLKGHTGFVTSVNFSTDGKRLISTDAAGKVLVWDTRTGRLLDEPPPPTAPTGARSPDGQLFADIHGATVRLLRPPDAEELLVRRARTCLDPDWHAEQAARLEQGQQWLAAAFHLEQTLTARPSAADRDRLLRALTETTRQQPELSSAWRRLALAQLHAGQADAFRRTCRQMQQRFRVPGPIPQAVFALGSMPSHPTGAAVTAALLGHPAAPAGAGLFDRQQTVRASVLRPGTLADPESWLPLLPPDEKLLRGAILCRAGKHADAVKELQPLKEPIACLFRALAEHGRGNKDAARQALDEAGKQLPPEKIDLYQQTPLPWQQRVESDVLRREVEALMAKTPEKADQGVRHRVEHSAGGEARGCPARAANGAATSLIRGE